MATRDTIFKRVAHFVVHKARTVFCNAKIYEKTSIGLSTTLFLVLLSFLFSSLFFVNVDIKTVLADQNSIQFTDSDRLVSETPPAKLFGGNMMKEGKTDFTWGVLAINFDKSSYEVGQDVNIGMAVLDDGGHTLCDARLTMEITAPDGQKKTLSTDEGSINISKECADSSVTDTPDYSASFKTPLEGKYQVHLTAETKNGSRSVDDAFSVENDPEIVIQRAGSMRIYPPSDYTSRLTVYANKDVSGVVTEKVPNSFEISGISGDGRVTGEDDITKTISWPLNLKKGESREIFYTYNAPDISPEFYLLGPAQIVLDSKVKFEEPRQWQIASDANFNVAGTSNAPVGTSVGIAVDGTASGTTTVQTGGTWSFSSINTSNGSVITVWTNTATVANQSTAVTMYNGTNITGMVLNKHVLTIGSNQNQNISVANTGLYDRDNNANIMHNANANVLTVDGGARYTDESLSILASDTLTIAGTETLNTLGVTINASGILAATGNATLNIYGNWANSGTFTPGTSTVNFKLASGTQTLNSGGTGAGKPFYNLTHSGAGTLQLVTNALAVTNDFTNSAGTFDTNSTSSYAVNVTRDYIQSGGQATARSSTITVGRDFTANGATSVTGYNSASVVLSGAGNLVYNNLSNPWSNGFYNLTCGQSGNNTNFNGSGQNIGILNNLTIGSGGITETDQSWNSISISGTGNALTVDATNSLLSIGGIQFYGNGVVNLPYLAKGYNTGISSSGDNTQINQTGNITIKNFLDAGGIWNAGARIIGDNVSGRVSSWITNGYDLTMWGDLELGVTGDTGGKTLNITNSNVTITGNFYIYASTETFITTGSTVTFNGTNQSITGNTTFNNFTKSVTAADTFTFAAGSTTTINGTATINGASGQLLSLVSSSSPTKWNFNLGSSATKAISYVSVKDSDATGSAAAKKPIAPTSSSDAGNTVSWFAGCPGGVVTSTADSGASSLRECIGAANTNGGGTISFNIATAANQNDGGGNSWWRISPTTALPTISANGTIIDGTTQTTNRGNTNTLGPEIEVYAGAGSLTGFTLASNNNTLKGVVIDGPFNNGVSITGSSNTVSQSYIGTNATGVTSPTVASGNKTTTAFYISGGASSNMIGGATSADRNVISGTSSNTIWLLNSTTQSNTIRNNYVGTTATGAAVIPNAGPPNGILFTDATHDNTVRDNVISGNYNGIYLDGAIADPTLNFIKGNTIGLNAAGTAPIANNTGIYIASGANNTTIGGTTAADRNIISGSTGDGIYITDAGSNNNTITGNYIGTNAAGTAPVANGARGVELANGCSTNTIGGVAAGAGNILSGNAWVGVSVFNASNTNIYGNIIGTGVAGTENLGNGSYGVEVSSGGASTNLGGLSSGQGNVIANSGGHGVFIQASAGTTNVINGNTIRNNGYQGIEILRAGMLIQANVVRNNNWSGIHDAAGASSNALIYHNTLHGNAFYGIDIANTSTGSVARNNIMTGNTQYGIYVTAGGSLTESYNDVTDASTTPANGSGRSNVALSASDLNANPLYVNSGSGNFNLTECTSPAVNAGVDLAAAQPDMNGGSPGNFNGAAPDMGAYETTCGGDTISGTVYTDDTAGSNVGSGKTVRLIKNGTNVGTDITRAGGAYSITSSISAGDAILVYIDGDATYKGSAVTISNGSSLATLNIYGDHSIITRYDNGAGSLTSANMSTALGAYSDTDIEFTVPAGVLTCTAGTKLNVPSTYTFAPGANTSLVGVKIAGTFTGGSYTHAVSANWDATSGTFTAGTSTVTFNRASGTQTLNSGGTGAGKQFYNLTHSGAGTLQLVTNALTVTNDFTNSAGTFDTNSTSSYAVNVTRDYIQSGGQATAQSSTITVGRDFTSDGGTSSSGYNNASVVLTGAGNLSYSNLTSPKSNGFYNLTCGQNGNNTNFNGLYQNIGILHNLTIGSGGITETADYWVTISISGTGNALTVDATNSLLSIGGIQFYGNGVVNLPYLAKGYNTGISSSGDNTQINQTGNITIKNYPGYGGIYNGAARIGGDNVSGRVSSWITNGYDLTVWGYVELGFEIDTGGKTLNITNSNVTIGESVYIYSSTETFTTTDSTVTANGASGTQQYQTQGKAFNNLIHSGAGTLQPRTNNLSVGGNFTNSAGTYDSNALTTTVTGLATVSGGTYSASTNTQTFNGGLTIDGGTFTGSSGTVDATDVTVSSGTLTAPSTNLYISGNLTNNGTFTAGTSTVTFDGAGISTITGSATAPNYAVTFNNLTVPAGKTVKFGNGKYIKVSNSMALNGTSGSHVTVTSDDGSNKWYINHQGTETISYVDIGYSGCDYTNSPNTTDVTMTGTNSTNNGNNEGCWVFPSTPNLPSSLTQKTSPGGVSILESAAEADFTPDLGFTISDPDAGNTVKYEVQVATNSAFTSPVIDYTHGSSSANPTTFSFTIGSYGGGTCAGSCPSTLSDATGYWWRVRAIDNTGTSSAWKQFGVAGTVDIYADSTALLGGTLDITAMTVGDFTGVALSGGAISDYATPSSFSVTDARGTGAGWNITVQATQFAEYSGGYVPSGRTMALSSLSMPQPTVAANGTSSPVPTITSGPYIIDSGSAVKIASAAVNDGMGLYDFTQGGDLTLNIPANAYATTYRSEVTISVVSGP